MKTSGNIKRRDFIKQSSLVGGGLALSPLHISNSAYAAGSDEIKLGVVGCGGRGTGAAVQALETGSKVKLVAMADVFEEQMDQSLGHIQSIEALKKQILVPPQHKFVGFDGYRKVIQESDVVILATPPAFRPEHFEAAVDAGKHVFMEKPVACDAPGIRKVLAAGERATAKNLKIVVGLQNRYDPGYIQMVDLIKNGAIGEVLSATCYYLKGDYQVVPRSSVNSELAYQIKNWHFFNWLWAAAPAGLQIHNTDIVHWVKGVYPVSAQGMGGRAVLEGPDSGDVFDHYYIEYTYADGCKLHSQIRVISNNWEKNGAFFLGSKGTANLREGIMDPGGNIIWKYRDRDGNPYQIEHDKLFEAILNNTPLNDTEFGAKSSLACIMARMACHSGQMITWEQCLNSGVKLVPDNMDWDTTPPILPDENGLYPLPRPGISKIY